MKHLIISRELPPAPYPPGGIGTYVANISRLLAERGETVHVVGQRWEGAPKRRETLLSGRLILHRIASDDVHEPVREDAAGGRWRLEVAGLRRSQFPSQWFSLQAALYAEQLIEREGIDVVEGQDWEAPLYYLLLRRELGLGPGRRPPCFVHLHSPTEFITRFNGQDPVQPELLAMKRMEDYCIRSADALLCPSEFLARQTEREYHLPHDSIHVIRLPIGRTRFIERPPEVWRSGSICYVGRLEPRKGVVEWVEAAVGVAREYENLQFEFLGSDTPASPLKNAPSSTQRLLESCIPPELRHRFLFHGPVPKEQLPRYLANAYAAVVPSRWENFPNTCIEAMCSGLPVIATRLGGMAEIVEDGRTGWLAPNRDLCAMVSGLQDALRRCAETPAEQRRTMGMAAVSAVRSLCDNRKTAAAHVTFRESLVRIRAEQPLEDRRPKQPERDATLGVVAWLRSAAGQRLLSSLRRQSRPPDPLCVVGPGSDTALQAQAREIGAHYVASEHGCATQAWNAGLADAPQTREPIGWMFLDEHDELEPDAVECLADALVAAPRIGFVSCWTSVSGEHLHVPLNPELPHQWVSGEVARATAFRTAALGTDSPFSPAEQHGFELWELTLSMLCGSWRGATYPARLAHRHKDDLSLKWSEVPAFRERRMQLLQRYAAAVGEHAGGLLALYAPATAELAEIPDWAPEAALPVAGRTRTTARLLRLARQPRRIAPAVRRRLVQLREKRIAARGLRLLRNPRRIPAAVRRRLLTTPRQGRLVRLALEPWRVPGAMARRLRRRQALFRRAARLLREPGRLGPALRRRMRRIARWGTLAGQGETR